MKFQNKTVMITGSSGGIGKVLVEKFVCEGATVYAHMRCYNESTVKYFKSLEEKYGVSIYPLFFDVVDHDDVLIQIKNIIKSHGDIDILVNNAGVAHGGLFQMTSLNVIKDVMNINLFSLMDITQIVLRFMIKSKKNCSIVNIASIAGIDLEIGNCAYGLSKAGVIAFTKTLSKETAQYNIRVNAVAPGLTDTVMATKMEKDAGNNMIQSSAMKRLAKVSEVAEAVLFFASDEASFINGEILRVDGG